MRNIYLAVIAACLIAVPGAFAQTKNSHAEHHRANAERRTEMRVEHHVRYLTTVLSLSDTQQQKATSILTNAAKENSPVFASLRSDRKELATAVQKNEPASSLQQISTKVGNDVAKLAVNQASAGEQLYQILNPQQQNKLTQLQNERHGRFGMGRHA